MLREARAEHLQNALQIRETRLRALVSARLFRSEFSQMRAERGVDGGRTLRRERATRLFGLAQLFKKLLNGGLCIVGSTALRGQRIDAIIDRVDLLGDGLQVDLAGAHIVKSPNDLVGDLLNDLTIDGRSRACLQLGLKRAQQGLDRIEINRRRDRVSRRQARGATGPIAARQPQD